MNREIKFRAFHKQSNKMYWFDVMNGNHNHGNGYIGMTPFGEEITKIRYRDNITLVDPTDCEIMQYTGLKDKNGKEIYDGDIYNADSGNNYQVFFKNGCFCGGKSFERSIPLSYEDDWIEIDYCTVIGNIHENSDLLK